MDNPNKNRRRWLKRLLERDFLSYAQYVFKRQAGQKLIVNPYHRIVCNTLQKVERGDINRLIINIPPSYTKTELAVVSFISHGLALNPAAKFIHTSYSDQLVLNNSSRIKEIIESEYYSRYWPQILRTDSRSKSLWANSSRGGLYAVSAGGAITGFHAGRILDPLVGSVYTGAMVIDDPLKANDAYSKIIRERRNHWINNTIKSRTATPDVPIILIMQRVHDDDPTGFLLRGGSGDFWHHLCIPANYNPESVYPSEYTHGIPIPVDLPTGPIWPLKHSLESLLALEKSDKYTYASQYMQRPSLPGGSLFEVSGLQYYDMFDSELALAIYSSGHRVDIKSMYLICDTAHKKGQENDYTVFAMWGLGADSRIYLVDLIREKMTAPEMKRAFLAFLQKWRGSPKIRITPREILIEDKASGIGLLQEIREDARSGTYAFPKITAIPRSVDKVSRAYSSAPAVASGRVVLPRNAPFTRDFVAELSEFSPVLTHRHDDQVDTMMDAISHLLQNTKKSINYEGVI